MSCERLASNISTYLQSVFNNLLQSTFLGERVSINLEVSTFLAERPESSGRKSLVWTADGPETSDLLVRYKVLGCIIDMFIAFCGLFVPIPYCASRSSHRLPGTNRDGLTPEVRLVSGGHYKNSQSNSQNVPVGYVV